MAAPAEEADPNQQSSEHGTEEGITGEYGLSEEKKHRSGSQERRSRSKSADRHSRSSSRSRHNSRSDRNHRKSDERSKSRDRGPSKSQNNDDDDDDDVRRRRKSSKERIKPGSYNKSASYLNNRKQEKAEIKGRKSSVLGSLTAFLEEGAEAPAKSSDARSVTSSSSRIRRKKSTSGSASVVGGTVSTREEMRANRRLARDSTSRQRSHSDGPVERSRTNRRSLMEQSRSGSYKHTRRRSRSPKHSKDDEQNPQGEEKVSRPQRRPNTAVSSGAEVPPGFPAAAANMVPHENPPERSSSVVESTAKIRERQQRRNSLTGGEKAASALDPDTENFRKARRRSSLDANPDSTHSTEEDKSGETSYDVPLSDAVSSPKRRSRQRSRSMNSYSGGPGSSSSGKSRPSRRKSLSSPREARTQGKDKDKAPDSLETKLAGVNDSKGSTEPSKTECRSAASAPVHSSKNSSASKRRSKSNSDRKSLTRKDSRSKGLSNDWKNSLESLSEQDASELPSREHIHEVLKRKAAEDLMNCSMASLDPSLLSHSDRVPPQISSIAELYSEDNEDNSGSMALGDKFRNQYGNPQDYNQSTISFDSSQLQNVALAFGGTVSGSSTPKSGSDNEGFLSPGCLRRKIGQVAASSPRADKRVSWVELPLHNPEGLVVKSTSADGTNETVTATTADEVPDMGNDDDDDDDDSDQDLESSTFVLDRVNKDNGIENAKEELKSSDEMTPNSEYDKNDVTIFKAGFEDNCSQTSKTEPGDNNQESFKSVQTGDDVSVLVPKQTKPNLSLDIALKRDDKMISKDYADERTVATSATSNTSNTASSERTIKTNNRSLSSESEANSMVLQGGHYTGHDAHITEADLVADLAMKEESSTSLKSSGSSSSSSMGRRRGKEESSSSSERRKPGSRPNPTGGKSKSKSNAGRSDGKDTTRAKEEDSKDHRRSKLSRERSKSNMSSEQKRRTKPNGPDRSPSSDGRRKPGERIKYVSASKDRKNDESLVKSAQESTKDLPKEPVELSADDNFSKPRLKVNSSIGSDDGAASRRRKSYLPRNSSKLDKDSSRELKNSVKSSLDKFLEHMDDNGPVIKDDNRSVYSAIQDNERKKRIRDKRREERGVTHVRRIRHSRAGPETEKNSGEDDDDNVSVSSAPMFSSKQAQKRLEEPARPVVNLKETYFSKKLSKLHVAF